MVHMAESVSSPQLPSTLPQRETERFHATNRFGVSFPVPVCLLSVVLNTIRKQLSNDTDLREMHAIGMRRKSAFGYKYSPAPAWHWEQLS